MSSAASMSSVTPAEPSRNLSSGLDTSRSNDTLRKRRTREQSFEMQSFHQAASPAAAQDSKRETKSVSAEADSQAELFSPPTQKRRTFDTLVPAWLEQDHVDSSSPSASSVGSRSSRVGGTRLSEPTPAVAERRPLQSAAPHRLPPGIVQPRFVPLPVADAARIGVMWGAVGLIGGFIPAAINGAVVAGFEHGFSAFRWLPGTEDMADAEGLPGWFYTADGWSAAHVGMRATVGASGLIMPSIAAAAHMLTRDSDRLLLMAWSDRAVLVQAIAPFFACFGMLGGALIGHSLSFVANDEGGALAVGCQRLGILAGLAAAIDWGFDLNILTA